MLQLSVSFRVKQFMYNGFCVQVNNDVFMLYSANFIRWTDDPGIALFMCSDGKRRLIPSCALVPSSDMRISELLPGQTYEQQPLMFGVASCS